MNEKALDFLCPGSLRTRTGGYRYDRRVLEGLARRGWRIGVHELDAGFPYPSHAGLRKAERILASLRAGRAVMIDGLALGGMADLLAPHASRLTLVALIHHPVALETGLDPTLAARLHDAERRALGFVKQVITTSSATAQILADDGVDRDLIRIVPPGTDPAPLATGSGGPGVALLCVGTLTPRKGHGLLVEALSKLEDLDWRLTCVGSAERDRDTAGRLTREVALSRLAGRIELAGEVDERALEGHYQRADLFVLASHYEGYGMVFDEALARGLPIVATRVGAAAEIVPAAAGELVAPGDADALANALRRVIEDPARRDRLRAGAQQARATRTSWGSATARFACVIEEVLGR